MGGGNNTPAPAPFANSSVAIGGNQISSTSRDANGNINTNYNISPQQQQAMDYDKAQIAQLLPTVNTIDPNTQKSLQSQAQAVENNGLTNLNYNYNQGMNNAVSDVARRFGGLNNQGVASETANLQNNYGLSQANLSNQYTGNLQSLQNNQLQQQYNYLQALQNNYNANMSGAYQGMQQSNTNTQIGNQYGQQLFGQQMQAYNAQQAQQAATMGALTSVGKDVAGAALMATGVGAPIGAAMIAS
jgi:hypothetical protein